MITGASRSLVIGGLAGKVPMSQQPYGSEQQSKANYDDPLDLTFLSLAHWFSTWFSDFFNLTTVDGYLFIPDQAKPKLPMKSNLTGIHACRKIRTTKVFIDDVLKVDFLGYVNNGVVCHREYGQFTDNL